jgi:ectoine hydroxylase-related dioxygenase (phytanoyl-CoA dioxygenase family)
MTSNISGYFNFRGLTADDLRQIQDQGYLTIEQTLTEAGRSRMLEECMAVWHAEKGPFDPTATWLQNALVSNIHHHSPLARAFYFAGPLVDVAQQIIGPNIKTATSQLTFKMRGNTAPFGWHQDNGYGQLEPATALTTLTALEDTDAETGCLWLLPGSHHRGQIALGQSLTADAKQRGTDLTIQVEDESGALPLPMKAGDSIIFHCHMLHKSEGNYSSTRDRRLLFMRYADADAVEVYNNDRPRLGRLLRGATRFPEVEAFEADLEVDCRLLQ